jgi:hypothetical protein
MYWWSIGSGLGCCCKSVVQDTTVKVAVNDMLNIGPEKTILPHKALIINLFKCLKIIFNASIIC